MRNLLLAIALVVVLPEPAHAGRPDPAIATWLSLGSTLLPLGTGLVLLTASGGGAEPDRRAVGLTAVALGSAIGPSVGKWYAGGGADAWVVFALRSLTTGLMTTGLALSLGDDPDVESVGIATGVIGGVLTGALGIYDIATASRTAVQTQRDRGYASLFEVARCGPWPCGARVIRVAEVRRR